VEARYLLVKLWGKVMGERGEWRDVADNISPCKSCES
jgi:hypothetical protein